MLWGSVTNEECAFERNNAKFRGKSQGTMAALKNSTKPFGVDRPAIRRAFLACSRVSGIPRPVFARKP